MWKDIPCWYGYIASESGDIAKKDTGEILKQYQQKSGYVNVWLKRGGCRIAVPVHRIVCLAFHGIEGYMQGMYVDHINTCRSDNRACNLHWVTPKENANNPQTIINRKKKYESY